MKSSEHDLLAAFLRSEGDMKRYLTKATGSAADAEDLAQEAWIKLARNGAAALAAPVPYLLRIARSLSVDYHRTRKTLLTSHDIADILEVADEDPSPAEVLEERDQIRHLTRIIDSLPERQRKILLAVRIDQRRHADIARELGVTTRTVEMDLRKALDTCSERLEKLNRG